MGVRLRLGVTDLGRIRFVSGPHPLGAAVLASQVLRSPSAQAVMPALHARHHRAAPATAVALHLLPARGRLPDFLTPLRGAASLEAGVEVVRSTDRDVIRQELSFVYAGAPYTPLRRRMADGDPDVLGLMTAGLHDYFRLVVAPDWERLRELHEAEVARGTRAFVRGGVDGLLDSLHPAIRWRAPVLEVDTWWSGDVDLDGRGLRLVPSILTGPRPRLMIQAIGPAVLAYPVPGHLAATVAGPGGDTLRGLLGRTRAEVLRALGRPGRHTTTALAAALRVSTASASEHATALRAAGLVHTERDGRAVVHRLTPLGADLLDRNTPR